MKHLFISYETAKQLKELDFDEPCFGWFTDNHLRIGGVVENKHVQREDETLAPTCQQAIDWFREKHEIDILPQKMYTGEYFFEIINPPNTVKEVGYTLDYYAALNAAIQEAINIVKNENNKQV